MIQIIKKVDNYKNKAMLLRFGIGYKVLVKKKEELINILRKSGMKETTYDYFLNFADKIVTISKISHGVYKIKEQSESDLGPDVYWSDDLFAVKVGDKIDYLNERIKSFCNYQCLFNNSDNCKDCYLNLNDKKVEERVGQNLIKGQRENN